jgi:galactose mutarotase-like enzyme
MNALDTVAPRRPGGVALTAGPLHATFDPARGMLGSSLRLRGRELLGPLGMPFLHPWANRLSDPLDGLDVPRDDTGLPIHGTHPAAWTIDASTRASLSASLHYDAVPAFPYAHVVSHLVRLSRTAVRVDTAVRSAGTAAIPIAFGFHPYFRLDREELVALPDRRRLLTDERLIPSGPSVDEPAELAPLGERTFDDGYAVADRARFAIGRRLSVAFLTGYTHAQVYAPAGSDFVCFEPMTAPVNALVSGAGLRHVVPRHVFRAAFEIRVA